MSGRRSSRRAWGWHPLTDQWARRVVDEAGVRPGQLVVDIGAGNGALTRHLVDAGARVLAVEPHPRRAARLRERFDEDAVTVVEKDALEMPFPRRPFRVIASPPYGISSALVRRLLTVRCGLVAADIVLQRAVVRRVVAGRVPPRWNLRQGVSVPRRAFTPPPKLDSAVLVMRRR